MARPGTGTSTASRTPSTTAIRDRPSSKRLFVTLSRRGTHDRRRSTVAAEHEVVPRLFPAPVRRADEHVARHAAHVVHHVAEDEAREAAVVGLDLGPAGRPLGRDLAVVDGGAARIVVHDEVTRAGEPGERLVVVAPELVAPARWTAEALLEEREGRERVL